MESKLTVFRNNASGYFHWIDKIDKLSIGYVLNTEEKSDTEKFILHKSTCGHINDKSLPESAYTEGSTIKVCSVDLEEIRKWAESKMNFKEFEDCKTCNPSS